MRTAIPERRLLFLIGAVLFVDILDFMMVMPLGPDLARALGIPTSQLGLVGASYTAAAAVAGTLGALVLDRFDRRKALGVVLAGLVIGTAAGASRPGWRRLLVGADRRRRLRRPGDRALAGDRLGHGARRSDAAGAMGLGHWRLRGGLGAGRARGFGARLGWAAGGCPSWRWLAWAILAGVVVLVLPRSSSTSAPARVAPLGSREVLRRPTALLALLAMAALMTGAFALVPNIATLLAVQPRLPASTSACSSCWAAS